MKSTIRFSDRVEHYIKYRPGYPAEIIPFLQGAVGLGPSSIVADIGSGTGIFTEKLLDVAAKVYSVEPNTEMRTAAEAMLADRKNLTSVNATAEATTLADQSIDIITCAQAFHWFDPLRTRAEFQRIIKPTGNVVLIWNDRKTESSQFLIEYERLLQIHGTDYKEVSHAWGDPDSMTKLFGSRDYRHAEFENRQVFDLDGMLGRLLSSSYVPNSGEAKEKMIEEFTKLFERSKSFGTVTFEYTTNLYYGRLSA